MSDAWITVIILALVTAAIKAAGPVAIGGRDLSPSFIRVISFFAPALLAALIIWETFGGEGRSLVVDARAAGLAVAAAIVLTTESLVGSIVGAAAATALVRLLT